MRASWLEKFLLLSADFIALTVCFYTAFWLQFQSGWVPEKLDLNRPFSMYYQAMLVVNIIWIGLFAFSGLYRKWLLESRVFQILIVMRSVSYGVVLVLVALF